MFNAWAQSNFFAKLIMQLNCLSFCPPKIYKTNAKLLTALQGRRKVQTVGWFFFWRGGGHNSITHSRERGAPYDPTALRYVLALWQQGLITPMSWIHPMIYARNISVQIRAIPLGLPKHSRIPGRFATVVYTGRISTDRFRSNHSCTQVSSLNDKIYQKKIPKITFGSPGGTNVFHCKNVLHQSFKRNFTQSLSIRNGDKS